MARIAVIIAAKDASRTIRKCLDSIFDMDYSDYEVIVADDGSEDGTLAALEGYKDRVTIIALKGIGPSAARNLAAKRTEAPYIAFTDSDCIVDKNWLGELIKGLESDPAAVSCGGIQRLPSDASAFERKVFLFMKKTGFISDYMKWTKGDNLIEVKHNPSCNVIYKRDIFLKEGGFLESLWPGEDVEFDHRMNIKGYRLILNPRSIVYHYRQKSLKAFLKMMYRYGSVQGILAKKYGIFRTLHLLPVASLVSASLIIAFIALNPAAGSGFLLIAFFAAWIYMSDLFAVLLALSGTLYWNIGFLKKVIWI